MEQSEVTQLLIRLKKGENGIYDQLYPLIYEEMKKLAYVQMSKQSPDHTLSKTELVHETYLKMIDQTQLDFKDKSHFLAISSRCMRQILIDYARKKNAKKRGGKKKDLTFIDELFEGQDKKAQELIDIDAALNELEKLNERLTKVVEMRFFGEMTIQETAEALDVSESTVKRDWMKARGWLYKELKGQFEVK
ncbi:RNA polymerase sigma factor, TIGR02999 family [Fodinibius roseus]|uniref:RNA polymerase sigma factor, TIGR02999 family n=1 Tax=Fodinibius roseus TaxID=1194090 RepID=A0A1M4T0T2_9BACT|nr:sigma-70 family RNA polymerase sigma factor [Fodinibius roseus]SHE38073.1 RNA polymerase sigma factor, TIGR02999 family [Fodinibius roseus]